MAKTSSSTNSFFHTLISSILLLFLHLGCCFIFKTTTTLDSSSTNNKKRKITPLSPPSSSNPSSSSQSTTQFLKPPRKSWSYIKRLFTFKKHSNDNQIQSPPSPTLISATSSQPSIETPTTTTTTTTTTDTVLSSPPQPSRKRRTGLFVSDPNSSLNLIDQRSFPLRNDIFPCPICGEIFHKPQLLEQHQSMKHAVSELLEGDTGKNIVQIIFKTGWNNIKDKNSNNPNIHRILKIHNSPKILSKFEDYREFVKSKEERNGIRRRDERCIADGNELLRFHCSTFICNLGENGKSSICNQQYCSVCGIIRSGFSAKMDGISTLSTSLRAHMSIPRELEDEFAFMNVKRVMLICRVIAGRIGSYEAVTTGNKDEPGFDSVMGRGGIGVGGGVNTKLDEEELIVFNPRAVLPCFAIIYSV